MHSFCSCCRPRDGANPTHIYNSLVLHAQFKGVLNNGMLTTWLGFFSGTSACCKSLPGGAIAATCLDFSTLSWDLDLPVRSDDFGIMWYELDILFMLHTGNWLPVRFVTTMTNYPKHTSSIYQRLLSNRSLWHQVASSPMIQETAASFAGSTRVPQKLDWRYFSPAYCPKHIGGHQSSPPLSMYCIYIYMSRQVYLRQLYKMHHVYFYMYVACFFNSIYREICAKKTRLFHAWFCRFYIDHSGISTSKLSHFFRGFVAHLPVHQQRGFREVGKMFACALSCTLMCICVSQGGVSRGWARRCYLRLAKENTLKHRFCAPLPEIGTKKQRLQDMVRSRSILALWIKCGLM